MRVNVALCYVGAVACSVALTTLSAARSSEPISGFGAFIEQDLQDWQRIIDSKKPSDFEKFLDDYPDSSYAPLAKRKLRELTGKSDTQPARADNMQNKPTLGLQVKTLNKDIAKREGLEVTSGLVIVGMVQEKAAFKAGLRAGDVIQSFNGQAVSGISQIVSLIRTTRPGDAVVLNVRREGVNLEVLATMGGTVLSGEEAEAERKYLQALEMRGNGEADKAWTLILEAAKKGHADAQMEIGNRFYYGQGIKKEPKRSLEWFLRAAQGGNPAAHLQLGSMYWQGVGTAKNNPKSRYHFRVAAEAGNRDAQYAYGLMLESGEGGPVNPVSSRGWIEKAASQGHKRAQDKLARLDSENLAPDNNLLLIPN